MPRRLNIRWRLTLWFTAAMISILLVRSFWIYFMMERRLTTMADVELNAKFAALEDALQSARTPAEIQAHAGEWLGDYQRELRVEIQDADRNLLFRSRDDHSSENSTDANLLPAPGDWKHETLVSDSGDQRRRVVGRVPTSFGQVLVDISRSMRSEKNEAWDFAWTLLTTLPLIVAAACAVGYLVSSRALTPVDTMISTAREITAKRLDHRVAVPDTGDELARLARTLNEMIDRLNKSFDEMRRFTADAAHDLRTPVTALRTEVEVSLMADRTVDEYRQSMQTVLEEAVSLSRLTEQLLDLSREDHDTHAGVADSVRLDQVVRSVLENLSTIVQQKKIQIDFPSTAAWTVTGDPDRLRRVFMNLLNNAIQYTPAGGRICIAGAETPRQATVTIADNGPGIPADDLPFIFDRFRRVDRARNRSSGGTGLGLAICKSIVEAHGGTIEMASEVGQGTQVTVVLPRQKPPG